MTTWHCGRCHQVLVPGQRPPLCLGGDYGCDVTLAVAVVPVRTVVVPVEQPTRLRVADLPRDVVRGLAGVLGIRQHGVTLDQLRADVEAALLVPAADHDGKMAA